MIVKEYKTAEGTVIRFNDEAYAGISPEEMKKRFDNINKVAGMILLRAYLARDSEPTE